MVDFREAVVRGQPEDRGLYFPALIPQLPIGFADGLQEMPDEDVAFETISPYLGESISDDSLRTICSEALNFEIPLVPITDRIFALELFHGPTLAFKDVGARFMSRCLQYFARQTGEKFIVIVATSGDTGGAVANGFFGVEGIEVVILYPKGRVSEVQELQLTTLGENVTTLALRGTFDDCQEIAKRALADKDLRAKARLTSANSINVARWLPQQFFYFYAYKQWIGRGFRDPPVFAVPSGNFGNLASGVQAYRSGLPVQEFVAACNANDAVPKFFETGVYESRPSVATLSNAMDVGDPSNFVRILELFKKDTDSLKRVMSAVSVSDERTVKTMREVHSNYGYVLDPHGAVAYAALDDHLARYSDRAGIFLETAHPVKFDSVAEILNVETEVPRSVSELFERERSVIELDVDYRSVYEVILGRTK